VAGEDATPSAREGEQQAEIERLRQRLAEAERRIAEQAATQTLTNAAHQAAMRISQQETADAQDHALGLRKDAAEIETAHALVIETGRAGLAASDAINARLEQLVAERTAEIEKMQETLLQAQKMEAIGQLTGGLAHDFNNLLTGITGSLEILQMRLAQGRMTQLDHYVTIAQGAAKRAAALTQRLLAFSRRQTLDPKPCDVNRIVAGMEELIRRTMGLDIETHVIAAGGLWAILIDAHQLENALLNLCINARDAMPNGGKLTIETANRWLDERTARARDLEPGQYVSLCVSDTGVGMSREVAARAFDPFYTTKPLGEGTGLGLSMIYGFVRQSGGQARIHSEPRKGTMVCLYLPRHHEAAMSAQDVEIMPTAVLQSAPGITVLVVDDEHSIRALIAEVLADHGYASLEAVDGASALTILQSNARIDLLISDVGLPNGMNGRQVADAARVLRPDLKVLFITGFAENAVIHHGHLSHNMHVMMKPFAMEALASRIDEIIARPLAPP
jgi:signal transduction histidine kinase/CheY-like chemotaxis protein